MKELRANAHLWLAGTLVAFFGVALVRLVAPVLGGRAGIFVSVAGQLLAPGGLLIICLGLRRRIELATDTADPAIDPPSQ